MQPSQPLGYLRRAQEMLVILGPDQGVTTWLWPEVCARAGIAPAGVRELSHVEGVYVPSMYEVDYDGPVIKAIRLGKT